MLVLALVFVLFSFGVLVKIICLRIPLDLKPESTVSGSMSDMARLGAFIFAAGLRGGGSAARTDLLPFECVAASLVLLALAAFDELVLPAPYLFNHY